MKISAIDIFDWLDSLTHQRYHLDHDTIRKYDHIDDPTTAIAREARRLVFDVRVLRELQSFKNFLQEVRDFECTPQEGTFMQQHTYYKELLPKKHAELIKAFENSHNHTGKVIPLYFEYIKLFESAAIASVAESALEIYKAQLEYGVVKETPNL